mmetsp:Transcript_26776/g.82812  ORF Transcript_26776/g.82812 Transcript_26776/m.82812 type:complete len:218 (+) Transcript_26776:1623-2276(+)
MDRRELQVRVGDRFDVRRAEAGQEAAGRLHRGRVEEGCRHRPRDDDAELRKCAHGGDGVGGPAEGRKLAADRVGAARRGRARRKVRRGVREGGTVSVQRREDGGEVVHGRVGRSDEIGVHGRQRFRRLDGGGSACDARDGRGGETRGDFGADARDDVGHRGRDVGLERAADAGGAGAVDLQAEVHEQGDDDERKRDDGPRGHRALDGADRVEEGAHD